jgi:hypothetical protein
LRLAVTTQCYAARATFQSPKGRTRETQDHVSQSAWPPSSSTPCRGPRRHRDQPSDGGPWQATAMRSSERLASDLTPRRSRKAKSQRRDTRRALAPLISSCSASRRPNPDLEIQSSGSTLTSSVSSRSAAAAFACEHGLAWPRSDVVISHHTADRPGWHVRAMNRKHSRAYRSPHDQSEEGRPWTVAVRSRCGRQPPPRLALSRHVSVPHNRI